MSLEDDAKLYREYFSVVPATTQELRLAAFSIRYQVYCVEHAWEDPSKQIGFLETDEYDSHAAHAVLIYRPTGEVCGCVRLILPVPGLSLPIVRLMNSDGLRRFEEYPALNTAEVSRYAVSGHFRRRAGEDQIPDVGFPDLGPDEKRRMRPHLTLGLLIGVARMSVTHQISFLSAVMSRPLIRLLSSFGMNFTELGSPVIHRGERQPCIASCLELLSGVEKRCPQYFNAISQEFVGVRLPDRANSEQDRGRGCDHSPQQSS